MNTLRYVESTILDEEFKKFNLIYRPQDIAIPYLFKVFGDFWRDLISDPSIGPDLKRGQLLEYARIGLGHCFRWLINEPTYKLTLP
jgi:hypothetical protein